MRRPDHGSTTVRWLSLVFLGAMGKCFRHLGIHLCILIHLTTLQGWSMKHHPGTTTNCHHTTILHQVIPQTAVDPSIHLVKKPILIILCLLPFLHRLVMENRHRQVTLKLIFTHLALFAEPLFPLGNVAALTPLRDLVMSIRPLRGPIQTSSHHLTMNHQSFPPPVNVDMRLAMNDVAEWISKVNNSNHHPIHPRPPTMKATFLLVRDTMDNMMGDTVVADRVDTLWIGENHTA